MCSQGINQNPRISKSRCKEEKIVKKKTPMDARLLLTRHQRECVVSHFRNAFPG